MNFEKLNNEKLYINGKYQESKPINGLMLKTLPQEKS